MHIHCTLSNTLLCYLKLKHALKSHKFHFITAMTSANLFATSRKILNANNISKTTIDRTLKLTHLKGIIKQCSSFVKKSKSLKMPIRHFAKNRRVVSIVWTKPGHFCVGSYWYVLC